MSLDASMAVILSSFTLSTLFVFLLRKFKSCRNETLKDPTLAWHLAMDVLDDPIFLTDTNDNLLHANQAFYTHINKSKNEIIHQKAHTVLHHKNTYKNCEVCKKRMAGIEVSITREVDDESNPLSFPVDIVIRSIRDKKGRLIGMLQSFHDITHMRKAETALRASQSKLSEAQRIGRMGNWEWNISEDTFNWSEEMWRLFGKPLIEENKSGYQNFMAYIHADDRELVRKSIKKAIKNKNEGFMLDHRISLPDGKTRNIRHQGKLTYSKDDNCVRLAGVTQDITTQKAIEHALHKEKEKAQVTLQSIGDAVLTMDVNGIIDYVNPVAEKLLMISAREMIGKHHNAVLTLSDETSMKPIDDPVHRSLLNNIECFNEKIILTRPNGSHVSIAMTSAPIIIKDKLVTGVTLVLHDVTEMRSLTKQLTYQASHDELTGLYNRREFEEQLKQAIECARGTGKHHSLIYMDLDQFKIVNDTSGHMAGDELLKQISELLMSKIRDVDVLARLGGDEFAVLLKSCPSAVSEKIAESIRQSIEEFRFPWDNKVFKIGVSIGVVPITLESGNHITIMRQADSACYVAKDEGRNRIYTLNSESPSLDQHHGEMQWVQKIRQALENNEFELFSQTIRPVALSNHAHFEILLRMTDGKGGFVQPDSFIPAAERYQLMPTVDRWVIDNTMNQLKTMTATMNWDSYVCSINLSGQSLTDDCLLKFIMNKLDETGIDPKNICFEITETTAIANFTNAGRFINALRDIGIRFSLDDFGSGLSSFDYLKRLNIDYLKIDGSFVKDIATDKIDYAMVESINQIGHLMGVETIAEFVETKEILDILQALKVDYAQGFHIATPISLREYIFMNIRQKAG